MALAALGAGCGSTSLDDENPPPGSEAHEVTSSLLADHQPFTVMTYNVRQVNSADTGIYSWTQRSPDVRQLISTRNADVFGVQEASATVIQTDLINAFQAPYDYCRAGSTSSSTRTRPTPASAAWRVRRTPSRSAPSSPRRPWGAPSSSSVT